MTNYKEVLAMLKHFKAVRNLYILAGIDTEWVNFQIDSCCYLLGWRA